ncbi:MAG: ACP S-malonyltransferase [Synechococcales bacterium]|nr:ACP S-malonyltransferase [Synechococcales bacterium]
MTKTAWVFPGQGSQAVGMGMDLLDLPIAQERFTEASEILGWSVIDRCQGDEATLSQTLYTQPCLYTIETILADLLNQAGQKPDYVAGHSLGEYSALYAAGVFTFTAGLKLIQRRATLMDSASDGMMAALLGADRTALLAAIAQTEGAVLANDNNDGQVVISGTPTAVETIMTQVKAKRAVKLNVSGAFHSPLMAAAATEFNQMLSEVTFNDAQVPVLSNVDPNPATTGEVLKERLRLQMTGSVRWREISSGLMEVAVERIVEVGPGKVLLGIMKRTCTGVTLEAVGTRQDLNL